MNSVRRKGSSLVRNNNSSSEDSNSECMVEPKFSQSYDQVLQQMQVRLEDAQMEILTKDSKLAELERQVTMTPQQLELVRGQAEQEMEAKCMERISRMEKEVKQYKGGYDEVLQKCASLVSQMECQRDEHAHILKEMNVLHETEISRLVNERKELVACCHHLDSLRVAKDKEALQKEKVELSIRMSNMEAQDALKSVKTENQWLRQQLERMRTECEHRESLEKLSSSKHMYKTEKEVSALNNQIEKLKQTHNLEIAKMKMELKSSKGELEREKKALKKQRDDLLEEIKKMQVAVKQYKAALFEKEQEMVKKVQSTREEELCRFAALHEEKSKLVDRLASLERTKALKDAEDISEKMEWEGRLHRALLGKESAQRELQSLRSKLQEFEETAKQQAELSDLQQQNLELRIQLERCTESKSDCRETLSQVHEELRRVRAEEEQLNDRYNKLQQKYFILKDKLKRAEEAQKTRKSLTESTERNLQNQIEQLEAKNEELQVKVELAKMQPDFLKLNSELYTKLNELRQQHMDDLRILLANPAFSTVSHVAHHQ